jgi:hypothetical protein
MKLHSPKFERDLLRAVKREVFATPALRKEWKRNRSRRLDWSRTVPGQIFCWVFILAVLLVPSVNMLMKVQTLDLRAGLLAIQMLVAASGLGLILHGTWTNGAPFALLSRTPIADDNLYRYLAATYNLRSIPILLPVLILHGLVASAAGGSAWHFAVSLIIAVLQWQLARSVAMVFTRWQWMERVGCSITALVVIAVIAASWFVPFERMLGWLESAVGAVVCVLPSGWLALFHADLLRQSPGASLLLLAPVGGVIWLARRIQRQQRAEFQFHEPLMLTAEVLRTATTQAPTQNEAVDPSKADFTVPPEFVRPEFKAGPTEIEDNLRSRQFLANTPWTQQGPIEHAVDRVLSPRERLIAEFMFLRPPQWSRAWRRSLVLLAAGALAAWLIERTPWRNWEFLPYLIGCFVAFMLATPVGSGFARGFQSYPTGANWTTFLAGVPIGYAELERAIMKTALVRSLAALPLAVGFGCYLSWRYGWTMWWVAPAIGFKLVWMGLAARPVFTASRYMTGIRLAPGARWDKVLYCSASIAAGCLFVALTLVTVIYPFWLSLVGGLLATGCALGLARYNRWFIERGAYDLTPRRVRQQVAALG